MRIVFTFVLLFPFFLFSQTSGLIVDKSSGKGVAYVNIWVENENIGTTSDVNGNFTINEKLIGKYLILSAVGYEKERIEIGSNNLKVELKQKVYEIEELVVNPQANSEKVVLGTFDEKEINHYFACDNNPWLVAKLIKFEEQFETAPFINKLTLFTKSEIKSCVFGLRFLSVDSTGAPGKEILNELVLVKAKKGKQKLKVDLSKYYIEVPENGLFIAVEWLIIKKNEWKYEIKMPNSNEIRSGVSYEPWFGTIPVDNNECSWLYTGGKWNKHKKAPDNVPIKNYENKFPELAIELLMTN